VNLDPSSTFLTVGTVLASKQSNPDPFKRFSTGVFSGVCPYEINFNLSSIAGFKLNFIS
jgi:hypothetical protein